MAKTDDLAFDHLQWLVNSRTSNQNASLALHLLLDKNFQKIKKSKELSTKAQVLVAVAFSLWRAAFLADKTGVREAVLQDARAFLAKMLTDNAITYPQDRASREWTFNYYMNSAKDCLLILSKDWPAVGQVLSASRRATKGTTASSRRWDRHQRALETAIAAFESELAS